MNRNRITGAFKNPINHGETVTITQGQVRTWAEWSLFFAQLLTLYCEVDMPEVIYLEVPELITPYIHKEILAIFAYDLKEPIFDNQLPIATTMKNRRYREFQIFRPITMVIYGMYFGFFDIVKLGLVGMLTPSNVGDSLIICYASPYRKNLMPFFYAYLRGAGYTTDQVNKFCVFGDEGNLNIQLRLRWTPLAHTDHFPFHNTWKRCGYCLEDLLDVDPYASKGYEVQHCAWCKRMYHATCAMHVLIISKKVKFELRDSIAGTLGRMTEQDNGHLFVDSNNTLRCEVCQVRMDANIRGDISDTLVLPYFEAQRRSGTNTSYACEVVRSLFPDGMAFGMIGNEFQFLIPELQMDDPFEHLDFYATVSEYRLEFPDASDSQTFHYRTCRDEQPHSTRWWRAAFLVNFSHLMVHYWPYSDQFIRGGFFPIRASPPIVVPNIIDSDSDSESDASSDSGLHFRVNPDDLDWLI